VRGGGVILLTILEVSEYGVKDFISGQGVVVEVVVFLLPVYVCGSALLC
jgi:hypothetical protein